ncbi:MAG: hypothetical protein AAGC95_08825 [Pseudomonadota bacterium]
MDIKQLMKRGTGIISFSVLFMFAAAPSHAACDADKRTSTIRKLYTTATGHIQVRLDETTTELNKMDCTLLNGEWSKIANGTAGEEKMLSLLASAYLAKEPVTIRTDNNSSDCRILWVQMGQ